MPARNVIREDAPDNYYHVYARGANKQSIFLELSDYDYFLMLVNRYLDKSPQKNKYGYEYLNCSKEIKINAYCLMGNHFHLLIYQHKAGSLSKFMKGIMISYSMYFNLKYKHSGAVFESRFKSSRISQQNYLEHISRYIHLNPDKWEIYPYSSIKYYLGASNPEWLDVKSITSIFNNKKAYLTFLNDYKDHREMLAEIKHELADS